MSIRSAAVLSLVLTVFACGPASPPDAAASGETAAAPSSAGRYQNVRKLADGVYTYEQAPDGDAVTTVSFFVVTDDGVLVADGQGSPEETGRLLGAIGEVSDQPVTHLVMGSNHGDHTGGDSAFPDGITIYASPFTKTALEATAARPGRAADAPPVVMPTEIVSDKKDITLGGRQIEILYLGRGHTGGDLGVYLPKEKILYMSEAYIDRVFPLLRAGYPSEWVALLQRVEGMDVDTYVAAHGVRGSIDYSKAGVERYRQALLQVIAESKRLHDAGVSADDAAKQANWGDLATLPDHETQGPLALKRVYAELDGTLDKS